MLCCAVTELIATTRLQTVSYKLECHAEQHSESESVSSEYCVQAGAGLVADSVPESEYEETVNKAAALGRAIDLAEQAFVDS